APAPVGPRPVAAGPPMPARTGLFSPARSAAVVLNAAMPPLIDSVRSQMFTPTRAGGADRSMTPQGQVDSPPLAFAADGSSGFYDLFRTEGRAAVSQPVSARWGSRAGAVPQAKGSQASGSLANGSQTSQAVAPGAAVSTANDMRRSQGGGFDLFSAPRRQS